MVLWLVTFILAAVVYVALTVYSIIRKLCANKYYHSFIDDELYKEEKIGNGINYIYSTSNETQNYIPRYILRKTIYDKSVVLEYKGRYNSIEYFIKCFNKGGHIIEVKEVKETKTSNISKIINVPKNTDRVNIFIKRVNNDVELNASEIRPISRTNIHIYSLVTTLKMFSLMYILRLAIFYIVLGTQFRPFLTSMWNYLSLLVIFVIALILYIFTFFTVRKRNWKNKNRGAVRYEFY